MTTFRRGRRFGSPAWVRLYLHALKTAPQLHLEVSLNITSGWNLGGPDVTPRSGIEAADVVANGCGGRQEFRRRLADAADRRTAFTGRLRCWRIRWRMAPPCRASGRFARPRFAHLPVQNGIDGDWQSPCRRRSRCLRTRRRPPASRTPISHKVIDLSAQVDAAGHIDWQPPSPAVRGRFCASATPTPTHAYRRRAAHGRDWRSITSTAAHSIRIGTTPSRLCSRRPARIWGRTLKYLATDSWEVGGTNWTGRFADEFRKRRGYDPVRYLPIVAGRIVDDRATSDRFLNDLRRTVGDLLTDHYDHFAERAKAYGLGTQCESGGPHGAPMDGLETFRSLDDAAVGVLGAVRRSTARATRTVSSSRRRRARRTSTASKLVAEEGMTSIGPQWSESLATDLKPTFDQAADRGDEPAGVARVHVGAKGVWPAWERVLRRNAHQSQRDLVERSRKPFFRYLNRSQFLMQQGHAVDDVLYFYGDEVPNFVRLKSDDPAHVLPGYDYDVTDEDALLHTLTVHDGSISLAGWQRVPAAGDALGRGSEPGVAGTHRRVCAWRGEYRRTAAAGSDGESGCRWRTEICGFDSRGLGGLQRTVTHVRGREGILHGRLAGGARCAERQAGF